MIEYNLGKTVRPVSITGYTVRGNEENYKKRSVLRFSKTRNMAKNVVFCVSAKR